MTTETNITKETIEADIFELNDNINNMRENMRVGELPDSQLIFDKLKILNSRIENLEDEEAIELKDYIYQTIRNLQLLSEQMGEIAERLQAIEDEKKQSIQDAE